MFCVENSNAALNEIKYEYDANQKLKRLYQSYFGGVGGATPYLKYDYDALNRNRLSSVAYPSGKVVEYGYDDSNNVATISENNTLLVSYVRDGSAVATWYH